jgi:thiosulfate dehydrogenase (quinone) large subunit
MNIQEKHMLFALRMGMSLIFLWAFIDKVFGLGFATAPESAWIVGGSPTAGYLAYATYGPLAPLFQMIAGSAFVDWLFMLGLLGIGAGLLIPKCIRVAAYAGIAMLLLMYLSAFPPEHHPFLDEHIIYSLVLALLAERQKSGSY